MKDQIDLPLMNILEGYIRNFNLFQNQNKSMFTKREIDYWSRLGEYLGVKIIIIFYVITVFWKRETVFYFYAINGTNVYTHYSNLFQNDKLCFNKNSIDVTHRYQIELVLCAVTSNELVSKNALVRRLKDLGFETDEARHNADFYYVLNVEVMDDHCNSVEIGIDLVNK